MPSIILQGEKKPRVTSHFRKSELDKLEGNCRFKKHNKHLNIIGINISNN